MDQLRARFTTKGDDTWNDWIAYEGEMDCDFNGYTYVPTIPIGYGATELEAIERLLELIGEDVAEQPAEWREGNARPYSTWDGE